ncbi:MAG: HAD-IB family hydrolase [Bacteroidales bacterium]|nr:HAD-IB family hydrolase [Bacteroidales bacterium]
MDHISSENSNGKSYVVLIDLDDTLLEVNSGRYLIKEAFRRKIMTIRDLSRALWFLILYKGGFRDPELVVQKMALWLKGVPEHTLAELAADVTVNILIPRIRPAMREMIRKHREKGASVVLLSAALNYVCDPVARHLNLDDVICSRMEVKEGIFTGLPEGSLCFGLEKERQCVSYCQKHQYDLDETYCYADSITDLPLLGAVGHPVCVQPDRRLLKTARYHRWTIL